MPKMHFTPDILKRKGFVVTQRKVHVHNSHFMKNLQKFIKNNLYGQYLILNICKTITNKLRDHM